MEVRRAQWLWRAGGGRVSAYDTCRKVGGIHTKTKRDRGEGMGMAEVGCMCGVGGLQRLPQRISVGSYCTYLRIHGPQLWITDSRLDSAAWPVINHESLECAAANQHK